MLTAKQLNISQLRKPVGRINHFCNWCQQAIWAESSIDPASVVKSDFCEFQSFFQLYLHICDLTYNFLGIFVASYIVKAGIILLLSPW